MKVALFDGLSMISLRVGQAEKPFFQKIAIKCQRKKKDGYTLCLLFLVPEGKSDVLQAVSIGYTGDAILTPSEGA